MIIIIVIIMYGVVIIIVQPKLSLLVLSTNFKSLKYHFHVFYS